jgi:intracellular septation protein A
MDSSVNKECGEVPQHVPSVRKRKLFSRDVNYLRDMALFWPFVLYSIFAVASAFSPADRHLALRCGAVALTALLLARERLLLLLVGLGFIAIQCAITLVLHRWSWAVFIAGILTAGPFLLANRYWRQPKLAYDLPNEFRLIDALWSVASICGSLLLGYIVSPFK